MYYVGIKSKGFVYELFKSKEKPTQEKYGTIYLAIIGSFRTKQGALFMAKYGKGNPHCQCVADAERLSKKV